MATSASGIWITPFPFGLGAPMVIRPDRLEVLAGIRGASRTRWESSGRCRFIEIAGRLAADGGLHRRVDIARRKPVTGRLARSMSIRTVGWPRELNTARSAMPGTLAMLL